MSRADLTMLPSRCEVVTGAKQAGQAFKQLGKDIGHGSSKAAKDIGHGMKDSAERTGKQAKETFK